MQQQPQFMVPSAPAPALQAWFAMQQAAQLPHMEGLLQYINAQHSFGFKALGPRDVQLTASLPGVSTPCVSTDATSSLKRQADTCISSSGKRAGGGFKALPGRSRYTARFRGVVRMKGKRKTTFIARIQINRKLVHIGTYATEKEAAMAYDAKAIEVHGDRAVLNFERTSDSRSDDSRSLASADYDTDAKGGSVMSPAPDHHSVDEGSASP